MKSKRVVILFSRLSDYMLNMFELWCSQENVSLTVLKKSPDKKEAPFEFNLSHKNIDFFDEDKLDRQEILDLVNLINPDIIICSGWSNSKYNAVISKHYANTKCILTMDNQWHGTLKQYLGTLYSRLFIVSRFDKIWVPGKPQKKFALKLGFKEKDIMEGWYVANESKFKSTRKKIRHEFIYAGRYVDYKGVNEMWEAFIKLQENEPNDWVLTCIGTGPLFEKRKKHPQIKHLGFLQPIDLQRYTEKGGVFVLPSHFEPWGVVVHEFALSGYPLIISESVGAASQFVSRNNGIIFKTKNEEDLYGAMKKIVNKTDEQLLEMGAFSQTLAGTISSNNWINNMNNLINS
ncbi:glycosyltransferase family 4 protein [Lacinutrix gracilariae]|uniref:Glycosyltransferase family 4 protein n=1 Tax=Lacinutrix gracilariae TaxID=1747198 RepID=A0ABW5K4X7_9FLAO